MRHNINIDFQRTRFERVNNYYGKQYGLPPSFSIIRIEEPLVNGQGNYDINLKKEILKQWESNMKRNDLFVTTHLGVFLTIDPKDKPGTGILLPYAFSGGGDPEIPSFDTLDINALYNGSLKIVTGNIVNLDNFPLALFKQVPEKQPSIITLDDGEGNTAGDLAQPAFNLLEMCHPMAEEITLAGTQDHKISISFPSFPAANYGSGEGNESKLVFIALGYKVVGGTSDKFKNDANPYAGAI